MKILIVDDDDALRANLQELLEFHGHTVLAAAAGREGIALAANRPDLVFCDVDMPEMDGFATVAALRQLPACRDIPIIFLTGRLARADQRHGMNLGADDYITKPFSVSDILEAIAARVHRQLPLRERVQQLVDARRQEAAADWSHELMTPLNAVLGGLELIEMEVETIRPAELKDLLGLVRSGAERQQHLARKLVCYFGLERLRAGGLMPEIGAAETGVAAGARRAATQEKRTDDVRIHAEPAPVAVAGTLVADAVAELVENACRYAPAGQPVTVTGERTGAVYRITVTDAGPGLPPEQRAAIGPFRQFNRRKLEQQGLGLGFAIAGGIAGLAGGTFALHDGPGGRGLSAVLELPLAATPA